MQIAYAICGQKSVSGASRSHVGWLDLSENSNRLCDISCCESLLYTETDDTLLANMMTMGMPVMLMRYSYEIRRRSAGEEGALSHLPPSPLTLEATNAKQTVRLMYTQWRRQLWGTGERAAPPPRLKTISFLVHFRVNLTANYPSIV